MIKLSVDKNIIKIIEADEIHKGEYKVNTINVEFSEEYNALTKKAVFLNSEGTYEIPIINNEFNIPIEISMKQGKFTLGIYAYDIDDTEKLELRYSPKPTTFFVKDGSYISGLNSDEEITLSQYEIYTAAMNKGLEKLDNAVSTIETKLESGEFIGDRKSVV